MFVTLRRRSSFGLSPVGWGAVLKRSLQTLEPKAKAVAPSIGFSLDYGAIQKLEKHEVEHGDLDIQLHQCGEATMDFRKSLGLGRNRSFRRWRRDASRLLAPERDREHSLKL
jgi:hypothetical protein